MAFRYSDNVCLESKGQVTKPPVNLLEITEFRISYSKTRSPSSVYILPDYLSPSFPFFIFRFAYFSYGDVASRSSSPEHAYTLSGKRSRHTSGSLSTPSPPFLSMADDRFKHPPLVMCEIERAPPSFYEKVLGLSRSALSFLYTHASS